MEKLPDELIQDIISRLPITSVFESRYTCKSWRHLINRKNHRLSILHFIRQAYQNPSPTSLILITVDQSMYCFPDINTLDKAIKLNNPLLSCLKTYDLFGSLHGFLFLAGPIKRRFAPTVTVTKHRKYVICNPVSGDWVRLPYPPKPTKPNNCMPVWFGFGYSQETNEYKVIRIQRIQPETKTSTVHVLTLGSNSWRNIGTVEYSFRKRFPRYMFCVDGYICWLAFDGDYVTSSCIAMYAFNVEKEISEMISLPGSLEGKVFQRDLDLHVFNGSLALADYTVKENNILFQIWVRNGLEDSWILELTVLDSPQVPYVFRFIRLLEPLKNGKLLLADGWEKLYFYDPKTRTYELIQVDGLPKRFRAISFAGTLVTLKDVLALK